jgi:hypothetical protein
MFAAVLVMDRLVRGFRGVRLGRRTMIGRGGDACTRQGQSCNKRDPQKPHGRPPDTPKRHSISPSGGAGMLYLMIG